MAGEFEVGSVTAKVTADLSQFKAGMEEAKAESGGLGATFSGLRDNIAQFADTAAIALAGVGLGIGDLVKKGVDVASQFEQTQTSFGTLLGSEQKAADLMKEIMQFEQKTPFDIQTLTDAAKQMLAFGVNSKNVVPIMSELTDMSQGQSAKLQELVSIYGQVNSIQQLNGREVLRLSSIGIPIYQAIEDHFKRIGDTSMDSGEKVKAAIAKGQISATVFNEVLQEMTGKGGMFFQENIRQMSTFSGIMSSTQSQFQYLLLGIMGIDVGAANEVKKGGLFYEIRNAAASLLDFLKNNRETIANGFKQVIDTVMTFAKLVGDALKPVIQFMGEHKEQTMQFLQGLALGFAMLIVLIPALLLVAHPMILVLLGIEVAVAALYVAWQNNLFGIRDITNNVVHQLVQFFQTVLMPFIQVLVQWWRQNWTTIQNILMGVWYVMQGIVEVAWGVIMALLAVGLALFTGKWSDAWKFIQNELLIAWDGIMKILEGAVILIANVGAQIFSALVKPFQDAFNAIKGIVQNIKGWLDFTQRHSPSVLDVVKNGVGLVNEALTGINFMPTVNSTQIAGNILPSMSGGSSYSSLSNGVVINLPNSIISDTATAAAMGEKIGDAMINKLKLNVRF